MTMSSLLIDTDDRVDVARLHGELDAVTGPEVRRRLCTWAAADIDRLLVDLDDVTEMDAAGLSAILMARRELRRHGITLELVGATAPGVRRTLAVTRFAQVFDLGERG